MSKDIVDRLEEHLTGLPITTATLILINLLREIVKRYPEAGKIIEEFLEKKEVG